MAAQQSMRDELEAKKAELESRVGEEEAALDAMLESLKGEMARIGEQLDAAQRELQPWEGKIADAKAADAKKNSGRKGITIVDDKPKRRQSMSKPTKVLGPPPGVGLLGTKRKPLIASGPKAPESEHSVFGVDEEQETEG